MNRIAEELGAQLVTIIEADEAHVVYQRFNRNRNAANAAELKEDAVRAYIDQLKSLDLKATTLADRIGVALGWES